MKLIFTATLSMLLLISACSQQDTEKTKQEAAKATQQIKEGSKVAAVELKKDAKEAAKQTKAIAEGVKQGMQTPRSSCRLCREWMRKPRTASSRAGLITRATN